MQRNRMSKLNRLKEQHQVIKARIREEESKLRDYERKLDTRRKVLAGATVLEWAKRDSDFSARLMMELKTFLVRDGDRALFNLPPVPKLVKQTEKIAS